MKSIKTIKTKWTGIRPLVMCNPQTVKVSNPYAVESRRLGSMMKAARKKGDENKMMDMEQLQMRNDWESSVYWSDDKKAFYIPDTVLMACIRGGATAAKKGKDVERAVIVSETEAFIETKRAKSLEEYYGMPEFRLECPCKIPPKTGALIWKSRCQIPTGWSVEFSLEFDDEIISEKSLIEAIHAAGRLVGIGGWRPRFGRFLVD